MGIILIQSLFNNHALMPMHDSAQPRIIESDYGIATTLLILSIIYVWLISFHFKTIRIVILDFFQSGYTGSVTRKELKLSSLMSITLSVFFVANVSLFIGKLISYYQFHFFFNAIPVEISLSICALIAYFIKVSSIKAIAYLFEIQNEIDFHLTSVQSFQSVLGLILFPIFLFFAFAEQFSPLVLLYSGSVVIIALLIIRIAKGVVFGYNKATISDFYLFLYLCAIEILPLLVIAKVISLQNSN